MKNLIAHLALFGAAVLVFAAAKYALGLRTTDALLLTIIWCLVSIQMAVITHGAQR
jgi:hypothetical protein